MRKTEVITIPADGGRDDGKIFVLTELPASRAEMWAVRCFLAMSRAGIEIPEDIAQSGLAGLTAIGLKALGGIRYEDAQPLLAEMFECVRCMPDPARPEIVRNLVETDTEEISTRLLLRKEVFKLHVGFWQPAANSISTSTATGSGTKTM